MVLAGTVCAGTYSGGDGQPGTPYEISTVVDWQEFMNPANSGDWDKHFILTQNIDFEGAMLTPVAPDTSLYWEFEGTPFTGVFDGDNKVLSNFVINQPGSNHVGLFGYICDDAEIRDLGLEDISVTGGVYVGILAGRIGHGWPVSSGFVTNCYVTGTVTGEEPQWGSYTVGGLCGASTGASIISNCYAVVTVTGDNQVGGLCGYNGGSIVASYATGAVSGGENYGIGGLCGSNDGNIVASYAASSVSGAEQVGGLCGHNFGTITSSYATGAVSGEYSVGGFCGTNYYTITECYSIGQVTGMESVGGFCGRNDEGSVSRSLWDTVTSGQIVSEGGTGLATAAMQTIFTYSAMGWGGTTWTMIEDQYPRLAWEQAGGDTIPDPDPSDIPMIGEGTIENPWQIAEAEHLILMGMGPWFWDKHYRLVDDLDLENESLNRIGTDPDNSFTGGFDGNGHTLSNLTIAAMNADYVGLFGAVGQGGLMKNLTLADVNILGRDFVGALCGKNQGTVDTCSATGQVEGVSYVGGLVGANGDVKQSEEGSVPMGKDEIKPLSGGDTRSDVSEDSIIQNSSADCLVKGENYVGGLVGANGPVMWDEYPDTLSFIINSHAAGNVESGGYGEYVGGLCGRNFGMIRDSRATGDVSGNWEVGGLCGNNGWTGTIVHAYATGTVNGEYYVGGLCGRNENLIRNGYATGSVVGDWYVGGLVGNNSGDYGYGSICESYAENTVEGNQYVGGLCGYNIRGSISKCYADSEVEGGDYVGGLVGYNAGGSIVSSYAHGDVEGGEYIGGLIGYNEGDYGGDVKHCYSTGTPTGTNHVGGLCGFFSSGYDEDNFWDEQSSGTDISAMGTGVEFTADMKIQATFTAAVWDFLGEDINGTHGTWRMCADGVDYPRLRWEFSRTGDFVCGEGVDLADLLHFVQYWLETDCECWYNCGWADINADGVVNLKDFSVVAENWLVTTP